MYWNPGGGHVDPLYHEPRFSWAAMEEMMAPYPYLVSTDIETGEILLCLIAHARELHKQGASIPEHAGTSSRRLTVAARRR